MKTLSAGSAHPGSKLAGTYLRLQGELLFFLLRLFQQWAKELKQLPRGERLKRLAAVTGKPWYWFHAHRQDSEMFHRRQNLKHCGRNELDDKSPFSSL